MRSPRGAGTAAGGGARSPRWARRSARSPVPERSRRRSAGTSRRAGAARRRADPLVHLQQHPLGALEPVLRLRQVADLRVRLTGASASCSSSPSGNVSPISRARRTTRSGRTAPRSSPGRDRCRAARRRPPPEGAIAASSPARTASVTAGSTSTWASTPVVVRASASDSDSAARPLAQTLPASSSATATRLATTNWPSTRRELGARRRDRGPDGVPGPPTSRTQGPGRASRGSRRRPGSRLLRHPRSLPRPAALSAAVRRGYDKQGNGAASARSGRLGDERGPGCAVRCAPPRPVALPEDVGAQPDRDRQHVGEGPEDQHRGGHQRPRPAGGRQPGDQGQFDDAQAARGERDGGEQPGEGEDGEGLGQPPPARPAPRRSAAPASARGTATGG